METLEGKAGGTLGARCMYVSLHLHPKSYTTPQVFHSLANFDIAGLFDVLESLGFSLKTELVNDNLKREPC